MYQFYRGRDFASRGGLGEAAGLGWGMSPIGRAVFETPVHVKGESDESRAMRGGVEWTEEGWRRGGGVMSPEGEETVRMLVHECSSSLYRCVAHGGSSVHASLEAK